VTASDLSPPRFATDLAIRLAVAIVVWGVFGWLVDLLLPTEPWGRFVGVLTGATVGLVLISRRALGPDESAQGHGDGHGDGPGGHHGD
jgi:F0F1-type ATP synthase assembly protein I